MAWRHFEVLPHSHLEGVVDSLPGLLGELCQTLPVLVKPLLQVTGQNVLLPGEGHFHLEVFLHVGWQDLQRKYF